MAKPPSRIARDNPLPFSLMFQPEELKSLRRIARKEGVAVGVIIRRAIYTVIYRVHPEMVNRMIETEVDGFLDQLAQRFPGSVLTSTKRKAFKRRLVKELV